jgi:uroporphyrinogen decarboxylase
MMDNLQNDLLLRTLNNESTSRPPVWMMRQAGRYLPSYMRLREKYDFFTRVQTPELACQITLQPVDQVGVDAAIIFSDILVIPQAMGLMVLMEEGKGPFLPKVIRNKKDIEALRTDEVEVKLHYVMDAISLTKKELNNRVPLIGFAGGPWTILCYMIEGRGSKTWENAKQFVYTEPELSRQLLEKITQITIKYLKAQIAAGADVIQVFDSWAGTLTPVDFKCYAQPYLLQIAEALKDDTPVILFPKGSWYALEELSHCNAAGIGIDWGIDPRIARQLTGNRVTLQGNLDPAKLLAPIPLIRKWTREMIDGFGVGKYIVNLGHGITPNTPVDHARAFVDAVKDYGS